MTINKRIVLDRCEVLPSGHIQIRHCIEEYDDTIIPTPGIEGVYEQQELSPSQPARFEQITEGELRQISPAKEAVFGIVTITEPVEAVTDIVSDVVFHRGVIEPGDTIVAADIVVDGVVIRAAGVIAADVESLMETHEMIPCRRFELYDRRYPDGMDSVK